MLYCRKHQIKIRIFFLPKVPVPTVVNNSNCSILKFFSFSSGLPSRLVALKRLLTPFIELLLLLLLLQLLLLVLKCDIEEAVLSIEDAAPVELAADVDDTFA